MDKTNLEDDFPNPSHLDRTFNHVVKQAYAKQENLQDKCENYKCCLKEKNKIYDEAYKQFQTKASKFALDVMEMRRDLLEITNLLKSIKNLIQSKCPNSSFDLPQDATE
ncbi:hypothetical protein RF11_03723 [Thelohanellus kitauei]|uniref:Uncharacterized protein n=1 Tax=Thelohanellus kitauei TaxID=669202 RepID=A0A0C2N6Y7_THEKT|nr:hypothetical protein RF11_03723 [Thelohanellus kitauei]